MAAPFDGLAALDETLNALFGDAQVVSVPARVKPPARAEGPRCGTCHRAAHWPGSPGHHGHAYRAPKPVRAEANRQYVRDLLADKDPAFAALLAEAAHVCDTTMAAS